jgi:tetratricopeptide (TPR) repeat protein
VSLLRMPVLFIICHALLVNGFASADEVKSNPERNRAFELYQQGKMTDAMPLLEALAAVNPKDIAVIESWGVSVLSYAQTLPDVETRKKARVRARTILLNAQALGDTSDLSQTLIRGIPEDGSFSAFSDKREIDEAMQQAEADFSRGSLDKARQGYMRAYLLDANQYYAALFIGDTFFRQHQTTFAEEWFANAVRINPDVETAYRYWGDALLGQGDLKEARSKYIEAIIADPYNQTSWAGLNNWLKRSGTKLTWMKLRDRVAVQVKDGKTDVTLDSSLPKDDKLLMAAWLSYGMSRALWMREKFAQEYPSEASYRHSLREETESLRTLIAVSKEIAEKEKVDLSTSDFGLLIEIEKAGFLEPFVLLNRADSGIVRDYPGYRGTSREKIRLYLDQKVIPQSPSPENAQN